jgi:hypothetical protein
LARQPLIFALALLLAACTDPPPYMGAFQLPTAAAVLQPEVGGPFDEPIGFVANAHGGSIVQLALKQGRFLNDDPTVSFLRTNFLATGSTRRLSAVAVRAPAPASVEVWAGDLQYETLLRVPYLHDCELEPTHPECEGAAAGAPVEQGVGFVVVESPASAELQGVEVKRGYTTTERFTIRFDGAEWTVDGTRSGRQLSAIPGEVYKTYERELGFTLLDPNGDAQAGDTFVVDTFNGVAEIDVGGAPLDLKLSPDGALLALLVADATTGIPVVRWFDPDSATVVADVTLAADAWPTRLAWTEDGALLVADRDHPAVWEIPVGEIAAIEHPTPWPTLDMASLDGEDRRRLYVVPLDGTGLWLLDRDTDELLDVNLATAAVDGLSFTSTVLGVEALPRRYRTTEFTDDTLRVVDRTVSVALSDQRVVWAHESTGCLVQDNLGPLTVLQQSGRDYATSFDVNDPSQPSLSISAANGRHVVVNSCSGIARSETWELRYDQNAQGWLVNGTISGRQSQLAYEDQRYLSDDAAVSFTIQSGPVPTREGSLITFQVDEGVPEVIGDANGDGVADISLGLGSDPVYFEYRAGLAGAIDDFDGEGWYAQDIRPFVLVLGTATNIVGRIDPQEAQLEVGWN